MPAAPELALLRAFAARGRFNGTPALAEARTRCAEHLRALGFTVREAPFQFSAVPARFGMPAVGLASVVLLAGVALARSWGRVSPIVAAAAGVLLLARLAAWLTSPRAQMLSYLPTRGVNLEAVGPSDTRIWLVAHLDSKSQRYPLAVRAAGAALTIAAWALATAWALASLSVHARWPMAPVLVLGVLGAALLAMASVGNASPGAVDNASGVAAVLAAAEQLGPAAHVGILITDAEELGLAGAHAWARGRGAGIAINCDTIDDRGEWMLLTSGQRSRAVVTAAAAASTASGVACRARPTPAGVFTDGVALARAGWATATLSRATLGTLMRIHTPRDSVGSYEGTAIAPAAAFLVAIVKELR